MLRIARHHGGQAHLSSIRIRNRPFYSIDRVILCALAYLGATRPLSPFSLLMATTFVAEFAPLYI
jgi:hypothetical protein